MFFEILVYFTGVESLRDFERQERKRSKTRSQVRNPSEDRTRAVSTAATPWPNYCPALSSKTGRSVPSVKRREPMRLGMTDMTRLEETAPYRASGKRRDVGNGVFCLTRQAAPVPIVVARCGSTSTPVRRSGAPEPTTAGLSFLTSAQHSFRQLTPTHSQILSIISDAGVNKGSEFSRPRDHDRTESPCMQHQLPSLWHSA